MPTANSLLQFAAYLLCISQRSGVIKHPWQSDPMEHEAGCLLAVDVGLRTGLALFGADARLLWYRSHHFARIGGLKRRVHSLLEETAPLSWLVLEGGGQAADVWIREAGRREVRLLQTQAQQWRAQLLLAREQRSGQQAKACAIALARRIIAWSGAPGPTALRHDTAEAICVGFWGLLRVGLLPELPAGIGH